MCIREALAKVCSGIKDGCTIEIVNELGEWEDFETLTRLAMLNSAGQLRKQFIIESAIKCLRERGTLAENIEKIVKFVIENPTKE